MNSQEGTTPTRLGVNILICAGLATAWTMVVAVAFGPSA